MYYTVMTKWVVKCIKPYQLDHILLRLFWFEIIGIIWKNRSSTLMRILFKDTMTTMLAIPWQWQCIVVGYYICLPHLSIQHSFRISCYDCSTIATASLSLQIALDHFFRCASSYVWNELPAAFLVFFILTHYLSSHMSVHHFPSILDSHHL